MNAYPELIKSPVTDGKKYYLKKRPGLSLVSVPPVQGAGRGVYAWNNGYYSVVGANLYYDATLVTTLVTSTGPVGWTLYQYESGLVVLILSDGHQLYSIGTNNVVTVITAVPNPHLPFPIYLDGYLFVAGVGSGIINNSTLNDPSTWPADGFITAEMFPDNLVALSKTQNYLSAIGASSIEWFYDNANATGSPMQRNAPAVSQFGCPAPNSINQTEKELIMVGTTDNGGLTVWVINGFQPEEIAIEPIREALDLEGAGISQATAYTIQSSGHKWYILNLKVNQRTFVYDFDEQMWHEWSYGTGQNCFLCDWSTYSADNVPILQDSATGTLYQLDPNTYTDNGSAINVSISTVKLDFDTIKRKRFFRLSLIADAPNGVSNIPITVQWSDDDYNTWVGNATLQINGSYPTINQLGYSRRRAFRFIYQQPYALRMESFEIDITQEVRR